MLGHTEAAIESLQRALNIEPNNVSALCSLYALKQHQPDSIPIELIKKLYANSRLTNRERILVCYTLARAHNKFGEENVAFDYLHEANKITKTEVGYKFYKSENTFSSIKKLFSVKHPILDVDDFDSLSKIRPIFIVGMPRSGTSLTEQILDCHTSVRGAGELEFMNQLAHIIMQEQQANLTRQYPKPLSKNSISAIRNRYHISLQGLNYPANIIIDKMPLNFRWIGLILLAFPEAKIIHLKRDPVATCWSNFNRYFPVHGLGFTNNLNDLAKFYHLYTDLMTFWHQRFPNKIYDLCYEDLTENQEEETRKLLAYCGLDWEENCFHFHENTRRVVTASADQVGQKMYQGSSNSWKRFEQQLQPLVQALNQ
ncbi:MAG: sulfotransferase [Cycloclasticus sp.]|nr:sulfotransferase [Cycloclasticus sp.]